MGIHALRIRYMRRIATSECLHAIYTHFVNTLFFFFIHRKGHILHFQRMSSLMRSSRVWTKSKKIGSWEFGYGCSRNRLVLNLLYQCVYSFIIVCCCSQSQISTASLSSKNPDAVDTDKTVATSDEGNVAARNHRLWPQVWLQSSGIYN